MKKVVVFLFSLLLIGLFGPSAIAGDLYVFPAKGQSESQMEKDKFECYSWAKKQTGFDPMEAPKASTPPPSQEEPQGGLLRGAARGALVGGVVGQIADDDFGKGAAAGAAGGALIGGMRRRDQARRQQQAEQDWANREASNYQARRNEYNRAYGACLEGKGYTVK